MKRILNFLLLFSTFIGYLEWGTNKHMFIFQMEYEILFTIKRSVENFTHPLILLPLLGQLLLLFTLFQKQPSKKITYVAMAGLGILYLLILLTGILSNKISIIGSALPFLLICILIIIYDRHQPKLKPIVGEQETTTT